MTHRPHDQTPDPHDRDDDSEDFIVLGHSRVPRCTARTTRGTRCGKPALKGQRVCNFHGGNAPQARAAAARKIAAMEAEREAERAVVKFGLKRDVSPSQALLDELQWTAGNVEYFRAKAQEVGDDRLVMGVTKVVDDAMRGRVQTLEARPSVWYDLWMREREHLVKVAAAAARAGVEQRRIELAESTGLLVSDVVRRILDAFLTALLERGIDVRDWWDDEARQIVPREFRAIEAVTL